MNPLQTSGVLDRGGRPTVRDLLSSLVFNPADGVIRLNGDRIVTQRASVGTELRRELIGLLGPEEARVFLLRLGYLSGQSDARFVRETWPKLDAGDAFTAGTRLHTFSGVVRVETVFNDFDLRRKRFAAEFRWHESVEAAAFRGAQPAHEPVCWTQIGYASGYASAFFDTLILYKELSCAAQGHSHCRVVGKPADAWGSQDPDVILFRERIVTPARTTPAAKGTAQPENGAQDLDSLILAPVQADLERFGPAPFPVLVTGEAGTGRSRAAHALHRLSGAPDGTIRHVFGAEVDRPLCEAIARGGKVGRRNAVAETILIDSVEEIPATMQRPLARAIEQGASTGGPRVVALSRERPTTDAEPLLRELWDSLAVLVVRMPPLAKRAGALADVARAMLPHLAARMGSATPVLDDGAARAIEDAPWPGNLRQMRNVLAAALAERRGGAIDGALIERHLRRSRLAGSGIGMSAPPGVGPMLDGLLAEKSFSLPAFEDALYREAVERAGGNLSAAARSLGLSRAQLAYRLGPQNGRPDPKRSRTAT